MSWNDLDKKTQANEREESREAQRDFARLHARVFETKDGAELLRQWKARLDKFTNPETSERALRELEGRRNLLRMFEELTRRGREQA